MLWTTALVGALLLQTPGPEAAAPAPAEAQAAPEGLSAGAPNWFEVPQNTALGFRNFWPRIGVQHRAQGYGYDRGYTSFDAFVPLFQSDFTWMTAYQGSLLIDNGGEIGLNGGLIQRKYVEDLERVFGANAFYNYRHQTGNDFHQIGFGVETLGAYADWRMNGYVPLGEDLQIPDGNRITDAVFSGRSVLVTFLADKSLAGFDTEFGGIIPNTLDVLRGYAGFYHFLGQQSDDVWGVQARLEARMQDSVVMHLGVTNDGTFGTNVILGAGIYLGGFAPKNTPPAGRAASRMADPVWRNQNIIVERSPLKEPVPARWADGSLIDVAHVDSAAAPLGDGSLDAPYQSLAQAQAGSVPGSIIFARANSVFNGEGIVLQSGQQLLGEGLDHTIQSKWGPFTLPTVTPPKDIVDVPLISNAPGDAVALHDNTVISGFRILNAGGDAVRAAFRSNVVVDRVGIGLAAGDGIDLSNVSGVIQVTENFSLQNGGAGIAIDTSSAATTNTITVSDNTVLQNANQGVAVTLNGQSANTLVMERNLVRVNLGPTDTRILPLVQITTTGASTLVARVENNDLDDSFARDDTSPDEDPYYHQLTLDVTENSRVDIGFFNNRLTSDRAFLGQNPANGSFGLDLNSSDVSALRAALQNNSSDLNYALSENFISVLQVEDTLSTNTGTFYYFPTANQIETISAGTLALP